MAETYRLSGSSRRAQRVNIGCGGDRFSGHLLRVGVLRSHGGACATKRISITFGEPRAHSDSLPVTARRGADIAGSAWRRPTIGSTWQRWDRVVGCPNFPLRLRSLRSRLGRDAEALSVGAGMRRSHFASNSFWSQARENLQSLSTVRNDTFRGQASEEDQISTVAIEGGALAGVIHQDLPHQAGGHSKKMSPAPPIDATRAGMQIRQIPERWAARNAPQLAIDQASEATAESTAVILSPPVRRFRYTVRRSIA